MVVTTDPRDENDYPETDGRPFGRRPRTTDHSAFSEILVEFVVVEGPEGKRLLELQSSAVRRILSLLAAKACEDSEEGD